MTHSKELAITTSMAEKLEFDEDYNILKILREKTFRRAIDKGVQLPDPPPLEPATVLDEFPRDDGAITDEITIWRMETRT